MSAFLVGADVIRLIAFEATCHPSGRWRLPEAREKMEILWHANLHALRDRYSDDPAAAGSAPTISASDMMRLSNRSTFSAVVILKQIACYEYQACDWSLWGESKARELCQQATAAAMRKLPGWEDAPWGL